MIDGAPLANVDLTPVIPVELGGQVRHMRFDLNAMCLFEEVTGESMFEFINQTMTTRRLRAMVYSCLAWEDPDLTLETVGGMISLQSLPALTEQLKQGMLKSLPQQKESAVPLEIAASKKTLKEKQPVSIG